MLPYALLITGVAMAYLGGRTLSRMRRLSRHGLRTIGTLVHIEKNTTPVIHLGAEYTRCERHRPNRDRGIYRYTDTTGNHHEIKAPAPYDPVIGESTVTVLYNPQRPSDALVIDALRPRLEPTIATIAGIAAALVGLYLL